MKPKVIESAPKDGSSILLFMGGSWHRGRWVPQKYHDNPKPYWGCDMESALGIRWCRDNQPTHWMPLPPPAKVAMC